MDEMSKKVRALQLEVKPLEAFCNPGCSTSTTSPKCTCPVSITTAGSLFTAKNSG